VLAGLSCDARLSEVEAGNAAIALTEAATNMLKHAGGGEVLLRTLGTPAGGVEILALDQGRGMDNWELSARDGYSTGTSSGNGLGAMRRLSSEFDVYTRPGKGTVFRMAFWRGGVAAPDGRFEIGAVCLPVSGETECGDAWAYRPLPDGGLFMVVDGLGHGAEAAVAARAALGLLEQAEEPVALIERGHGALRATRGAALAVVATQPAQSLQSVQPMRPRDGTAPRLRFAGVGNVSAGIHTSEKRRQFASQPGIVGHNMRKVGEQTQSWSEDALLIMHSDGMATHWSLDKYPGLGPRHAGVVAAVLYRDLARGRDDVTVLVVRNRGGG